jgi:hypothetical protein
MSLLPARFTPPPMIEPDETAFGHALDPIGEVSVNFSRD